MKIELISLKVKLAFCVMIHEITVLNPKLKSYH